MSTSTPVASTRPPPCVYLKGGICDQHGPGAKRRWRLRKKETINLVGAGVKTVMTREYYYTCDVGPGGKKNIQTRLFPLKTAPKGRRVEDRDDTGRGAYDTALNFNSDAYSGAIGKTER